MIKGLRLSNNKQMYRAVVQHTDFLNWERNRVPDLERVQEILIVFRNDQYLHIPGYITVFKKDRDYYIIDGSHRYTAAKEYAETDVKNISMDVCVIETNEPDVILKEFQLVNKSVPPPDFLMNEVVNTDKRHICESIVEWMSLDYKSHCMTTKKPKRPNFRKDDLINTLYETIPDNSTITYEQVKQAILDENKESKDVWEDKAANKCKKSGFYLLYDLKWTEKLRNRLLI